jgi:hypothetical protein
MSPGSPSVARLVLCSLKAPNLVRKTAPRRITTGDGSQAEFYYMDTHTYIIWYEYIVCMHIYISHVVILKKKNMEVSRTSSPTCE